MENGTERQPRLSVAMQPTRRVNVDLSVSKVEVALIKQGAEAAGALSWSQYVRDAAMAQARRDVARVARRKAA